MKTLLIVLAFASATFGQTTAHAVAATTQPLDAQIASALERLQQATHRVAEVRDALRAEMHSTDAYKKAAAEMQAKAAAMLLARQRGSSQEKLDASGAFVKASKVVQQMGAGIDADQRMVAARSEAARADLDYRALREQEIAIRAAEAQAAAESLAKDPIQIAIKAKRLVPGMTLEQATVVMGNGHPSYEDADGNVEYEWRHYRSSGFADVPASFVGSTTATFRDGKITSVRETGSRGN